MFHHRFLLLLLVAQVASFTVNPCGRLQGYGVAVSGLQKQRLYSDVNAADVSDTDVSNSSDLLEKPEDTPDSAEVSDSVDLSGSVEKNAEESESVVSEAEASPASAEKKFTAFVGNLPYTSSVMEIRELFGQYGEVVYVNLPRDKVSGRAKGFAFVDMASKDDLDKAIEALNGMEMGGRAIRVAASVPKEELPEAPKRNVPKDGEKLYVGNLPFEATESDIRDFFSEYGTVQGIYMPKSDDGTPRGYAFVTMSKDSYEKTLEATHEAEFMGRLLKVNTPLPPGERSKARGDSVRSSCE
jgi:RNA recognition motif-containing protein